MRHLTLISEFLSQPWAIEQTRLAVLAGVISRWALGQPVPEDVRADMQAVQAARQARRAAPAAGGVAVIPIHGVMTQRSGMFSDVSGVCGADNVSSDLNAALADPAIASIVLDIDSPGGSVSGIQELADEINAAKARKPVVAVSNSLAASAAYWVGSQASEFYCTPSGSVGSIGVYAAHEDWSKALEAAGVKVTLVSAGKYKTEGNAYEPLSADAQTHMQETIDAYYSAFVKAVARGRNVGVADVRGGMGQGRCLGANEALAAGMIDGIKTLGDVIRAQQRRVSARGNASARNREVEILSLS